MTPKTRRRWQWKRCQGTCVGPETAASAVPRPQPAQPRSRPWFVRSLTPRLAASLRGAYNSLPTQPPAATNAGIVDATKDRSRSAGPRPHRCRSPRRRRSRSPYSRRRRRAPAPAPQSDASSLDCGPKIKLSASVAAAARLCRASPTRLADTLGRRSTCSCSTLTRARGGTRTTHLAPLSSLLLLLPSPCFIRLRRTTTGTRATARGAAADYIAKSGRPEVRDGGGSGGLLQGQHTRSPADDARSSARSSTARCRRPPELGRLRCGRSRGGDQSQA